MRTSAERAGRDPLAITPCFIQVCVLGRDETALAEVLAAPLVKSFLLQVSAELLRARGFEHPMGENWRGFHDIDPAVLTRERIIDFLDRVEPEMILAVVPHGTPTRWPASSADYVDAGLRVPKILDYGAMAGLDHAAASAANVRAAEDELMAAVRGRAVTGLDAAAMLRRAESDTGLHDYSDPTLPERFGIAVEHLNRLGLDPHGRRQAADVCHWLLTTRLEFFADRTRFPVADEVIERADVRHRRTPLGHHAHARADVGGPGCPRAAILGGDVPLAPAGHQPRTTIHAGRAPTRTGGRSTRRCRNGCTATPTTTCSATACPRTNAPGRSISG